MTKKAKHSKKQQPITLYTVSADHSKMWPVPEDEEVASQPLGTEDSSNVQIVKKENKSPLEATFTGIGKLEDATDPEKTAQSALGKPIKAKKSTDYTALEFVSTSSHTNSVATEDGHRQVDLEHIPEDERVLTSLIALFLEAFKPLWSLGIAYYYFWSGNDTALYIMTAVIMISGFCTHFVYFMSRHSPIKEIWRTNKFISLLCAIPFALPVVLALCNCLFALKEANSRMYTRPWTNTLTVFMVESLTLCFPQCVLQMCLLLEYKVAFPSITGFGLLLGLAMLSFDITFTRIRHDAHKKCERFGDKWEKCCRYVYIWANKVLWFSTYAIVIVSMRMCFPAHIPLATAVSAATIFLIHELMVIISVLPFFEALATKMGGLLFIFPQFVCLVALVIWVNTDKTIYDTDIGSFFLGVIFWGECIILAGWLFDRGLGKEPDFLPVYPHFTGDAFTYIFQENK